MPNYILKVQTISLKFQHILYFHSNFVELALWNDAYCVRPNFTYVHKNFSQAHRLLQKKLTMFGIIIVLVLMK